MVQCVWLLRNCSHPICLTDVPPCCVLQRNLSLSIALWYSEGCCSSQGKQAASGQQLGPCRNTEPAGSSWLSIQQRFALVEQKDWLVHCVHTETEVSLGF